jgi:hypothetical protein
MTYLLATLMILAACCAPLLIDYLTRNCPGRDGKWLLTKGN